MDGNWHMPNLVGWDEALRRGAYCGRLGNQYDSVSHCGRLNMADATDGAWSLTLPNVDYDKLHTPQAGVIQDQLLALLMVRATPLG